MIHWQSSAFRIRPLPHKCTCIVFAHRFVPMCCKPYIMGIQMRNNGSLFLGSVFKTDGLTSGLLQKIRFYVILSQSHYRRNQSTPVWNTLASETDHTFFSINYLAMRCIFQYDANNCCNYDWCQCVAIYLYKQRDTMRVLLSGSLTEVIPVPFQICM